MALRFRRSVKIAPGFRLNFGKTGMSMSAGVRGATMTFGSKGVYGNVGIPGSGLSYRTRLDGGGGRRKQASSQDEYVSAKISLGVDEKGYVIAKDLNGNDLSKKYVKIARDQTPDTVNSWLKDECDKLNNDVDSILQIHTGTPSIEDFATFPEYEYGESKPEKGYRKPITLLAKIFPFIRRRIEAENAEKDACYEQKVAEWEKGLKEFEEEKARFRHNFEVGRFEDVSVMEDFLEDVLQGIGWPRETIVDFDIQNDGAKVMVDLDLPEIEDLPNTTAEIAQSGLKLNFKKRSATQVRKDYMVHVHGIGFRTIGTIFAALPKAEEVVLSVYSQRNDPSTGNINDEYLYSVRAERSEWTKINFKGLERVDVVECLGQFEIVRSMTKTGVFKAIEPLSM